MIKATCVLITRDKEYPQVVLDHVNSFGFDEVIVKTESPSVYERYVQSCKARNEVVYVQDDDAIVDIQALWDAYNGQLTNGMTENHNNWYKTKGGITLVGWGCFFPKKMLDSFHKYVDMYGKDEHLLREADRIFTYLNQPHNTIIMSHEDLPQVNRMSTTDPNHYVYIDQVLEKLRLIK